MRTVVGLFDRFENAQAAVNDLRSEGFAGEDISLVAKDANGDFNKSMASGSDQSENIGSGTAKGAGLGAVLGGVGGFLVGMGLLAIPGVGPVLAAGPIAAALAGAGMGAVAGGLLGALVDMGIPDEHAEVYAEGVRRGGTLVVVRSQDDLADRAVSILNGHSPIDVDRRSAEWRSQNWTGFDPNAEPYQADQTDRTLVQDTEDIPVTGSPVGTMDLPRDTETTIPVIEENIQVGKRQVDRGGVQIETNIVETPVDEEVRLRREQVNVERRPVDRPASDADFEKFKEGNMEFRETEEQPVVQKTSRVVEEIHVDKTVEEDVHHVQDTVRRTNVDIHNTGEDRGMTGLSGTSQTMGDWNQYDAAFQNHYNSSYGSSGHGYSYYLPAYQYGYQLASEPRYRSYDWNRLELEARQDWQTAHQDTPWQNVRDAVRHAWESVRR